MKKSTETILRLATRFELMSLADNPSGQGILGLQKAITAVLNRDSQLRNYINNQLLNQSKNPKVRSLSEAAWKPGSQNDEDGYLGDRTKTALAGLQSVIKDIPSGDDETYGKTINAINAWKANATYPPA